MCIITILVLTFGFIVHVHITGSVYGRDDVVNQGNNLSKNAFINQSKEHARVEKIILYRPYLLTSGGEVKNLVENETVVFSGFVQSSIGLRGNSVSLYEVSKDKDKDNLLGIYVIDDPVSTQFSFKVKMTPKLVKTSTESGNQLQFKVYHGDVSSNTITAKILFNSDKANYQHIFNPQKYNIPQKVGLSSTFAGKTSNTYAYLTRYEVEVADKSTSNVQVYANPEDNVDRFDTRRDYNWNLTSGKSVVSLKFENGNPMPLFLDMFLKQFEYVETRYNGSIQNESIPVLYRFDTFKDETLKMKTPSVHEGVYTTIIKAFFENGIRATYVLSKTGVWLN